MQHKNSAVFIPPYSQKPETFMGDIKCVSGS
jgi:hypothetical protein